MKAEDILISYLVKKNTIVDEIFFKNLIFKNFCLNLDEKKIFGTQLCSKKYYTTPLFIVFQLF